MAAEGKSPTTGYPIFGVAAEIRKALKRFEDAVRRHEMRGSLLGSNGDETQELRDETVHELIASRRALYKLLPRVER